MHVHTPRCRSLLASMADRIGSLDWEALNAWYKDDDMEECFLWKKPKNGTSLCDCLCM
jgi:hypothetical protein